MPGGLRQRSWRAAGCGVTRSRARPHVRRGIAVIGLAGRHTRRNSARHSIEQSAAMMSTSHGPWKLETRYCGSAKATPATRIGGQISTVRRSPAKAATSQNGTTSEKNGSCRPTMPLSSCRSRPVTADSAMMGVPSAPKATGAVLAMSDRPEAASGRKPSPISMAAVTATGVPNPAAPSKKAPRQKAMNSTCSRRSSLTAMIERCSTAKSPRSLAS